MLPNPVLTRLSGHSTQTPLLSNPLMSPFDTQVSHERQICLRFHRILKVILEMAFLRDGSPSSRVGECCAVGHGSVVKIATPPYKLASNRRVNHVSPWNLWVPRKTIGYLLCTTSSFVHHFKAMGEFKPESQSSNAQFLFNSTSVFFCPLWPWNLMNGLENNRTPLLYYVKLCPWFQSHQWIQTGATLSPETFNSGQNRRFFCPVWPRNLTDDREKP